MEVPESQDYDDPDSEPEPDPVYDPDDQQELEYWGYLKSRTPNSLARLDFDGRKSVPWCRDVPVSTKYL